MNLFKATVAVVGISLCLAGCKKADNQNATDNSTINAATAPAADMNATDMNATDMNTTGKTAHKGGHKKGDPGTRG
jgi:outer membrane murein-binding lipoprotein Lpp